MKKLLIFISIILICMIEYMKHEHTQYIEKIKSGKIEVICYGKVVNDKIEDVLFMSNGPVFKLKGSDEYISCNVKGGYNE